MTKIPGFTYPKLGEIVDDPSCGVRFLVKGFVDMRNGATSLERETPYHAAWLEPVKIFEDPKPQLSACSGCGRVTFRVPGACPCCQQPRSAR